MLVQNETSGNAEHASDDFVLRDDDTGEDRDIYPRSVFSERPILALLSLSLLLSLAAGIFAGFLQLY
jgi:hypothetical protein